MFACPERETASLCKIFLIVDYILPGCKGLFFIITDSENLFLCNNTNACQFCFLSRKNDCCLTSHAQGYMIHYQLHSLNQLLHFSLDTICLHVQRERERACARSFSSWTTFFPVAKDCFFIITDSKNLFLCNNTNACQFCFLSRKNDCCLTSHAHGYMIHYQLHSLKICFFATTQMHVNYVSSPERMIAT